MADFRNDLAKARDEWLESKEGKECCQGEAKGQYLKNRLVSAYIAGWNAKDIKPVSVEILGLPEGVCEYNIIDKNDESRCLQIKFTIKKEK